MSSQPITAVLVHRPDSAILHCDGQAQHLFKRNSANLAGRNLTDTGLYFVHEDGSQIPAEEFPVSLAVQEKRQIENITIGMYCQSTKTLSWLKVDAQPQFDDEGQVTTVTATYSDITLNTEKRLAESLSDHIKDEWERTFDALADVVTILSPQLQIIRANKATYTTFNLENEILSGRYCYQVFHGKQAPCDDCPLQQANPKAITKRGIVYNDQIKKTFEVSSSPVLDHDGTIKFLVHTARDITQKIRDEAERMILSAATEQTTESVVITDAYGTIEYVNQSYTRTTGFSRQEAIGQNLSFLNIHNNSEAFFEAIWSNLRRGNVWQGRLTNRKKDGTVFEESATISPVFDSRQTITNYIAVKRDVTKEEQLQLQLQQAMKMEAIGTLAGGIAHDFNNILSAMIGYGQIARSRLSPDDPISGDIEQILTAGDRAANLVKQILTFSRRDSRENFQPLRIQYIVKEVLNLIRSSFPATIQLHHHIDNNCGPILADPGQIHQVLMNLCTNSKQAIGGSYGRLSIELRQFDVYEPRLLSDSSLLEKGSYLDLMIKDNGIGMSDEIRKRIFDPFFTTKPKDHGTGLGLSVVHGIVKKHGGCITVDSRIGEGTTFHMYFPLVNEETLVEKEEERESRGNERVMVIDDEAVIARVTCKMLEKLGYKITMFCNSLKAVSYFRKNPYAVDIVITDMTMPDMTGAEMAREFLSLRPDIPIIMITGYSEVINKEKAERIGIREFMFKPVKKKQLSQMVRKVLDNGENISNR